MAQRYRDEIIPLRKKIADETLLRYNGMLVGVFELLNDAHEQIAATRTSLAATRDYWLADNALQTAMCDTELVKRLTAMTNRTPISYPPFHRRFDRRCHGVACRRSRLARNAQSIQSSHGNANLAAERPAISPGRHAQWLVTTLAHEPRREGISSSLQNR